MDAPSVCSRVNDALVEIHRSLVQYTTEVISPWSATDDNELKRVVQKLATEQQANVKQLVQFLISRGERVDFGVYPQHYGGLHFVEIDYLRSQLLENIQSVIEELNAVLSDVSADSVATQIVRDAIDAQENGMKALMEAKTRVA